MDVSRPRHAIAPCLAATLALTLMILPGGSRADEDFFGYDERVVVKPTTLPWRAIGKVNFAGDGHCTGTLIAADIVLTAAHCLFDEVSDDEDEAEEFVWDPPLYFLAGFHEGRFAAGARIVDTWMPADFDIDRFAETFEVDNLDYALLRLGEPIGQDVGWFDVGPLDEAQQTALLSLAGPKVNQAGYSADSERRMTAHIGCRLLKFEPNDTLLHQCDTMVGDSGSPLFFQEAGRYRLIALESQSLRKDGELVNSAVDARSFFEPVQRYISTVNRTN
ncbi:MAG: trypsin-like peptidase domain-containing protein [Pseudomonadota bacterium]